MATIEALVARDGPECFWCARWVPPQERTREHLVPDSAGGRTNGHNLVLACQTCNNCRGFVPAGLWRVAIRDAIADPVDREHPAVTARSRLRRRPLRGTDDGLLRVPNPECPNADEHTPEPTDFGVWHEWVGRMGKTYERLRCPGCGRLVIWRSK